MVLDKRGLLDKLEPGAGARFELGCGGRKREPEAIGIDSRDLPAVDVVGDVYEVLGRIPPGAAAEVYSSHFLEHVDDLPRLLAEAARVLAPGGRMVAVVPHFSNPYFYSDPTHRRFFGLYTLSYYVRDELFARRVPQYAEPLPFHLLRADLVFRSPRPFRVRRWLKRLVGAVVNLSAYTRELYEECFCQLFPCYEIRFVLERHSDDLAGTGSAAVSRTSFPSTSGAAGAGSG